MIKINEEKAVTLVALIITIILIFILGAVSLYFAIGDGGIISKSKQGISAYKEKSIREQVELKLTDWKMKLLNDNKDSTINNILDIAKDDSEIKQAMKNGNNLILIIDEYQCEINNNLEIVGNISIYNPETAITKATRSLEFCTIKR